MKPKPTPKPVVQQAPVARNAPVATPTPKPVVRPPHDRHRVPLTAFSVSAAPLDRGLLAVAGLLLVLVALGSGVVLAVARRELRGLTA